MYFTGSFSSLNLENDYWPKLVSSIYYKIENNPFWLEIEVPSYFIDLLYDKNTEIQKLADQALDLIMVGLNNVLFVNDCTYSHGV